MSSIVFDFIINKTKQYFPDLPVRIFLIGSRSKGNSHNRSDYDVVFDLPDTQIKNKFFVDVAEFAPTLCGIDAIDFSTASKEIQNEALTTGKIIYDTKSD